MGDSQEYNKKGFPKYNNLKFKSLYNTLGSPEHNQRIKEKMQYYAVTGKNAIAPNSNEGKALKQKWKEENAKHPSEAKSFRNYVVNTAVAGTNENFNAAFNKRVANIARATGRKTPNSMVANAAPASAPRAAGAGLAAVRAAKAQSEAKNTRRNRKSRRSGSRKNTRSNRR